MKAQMERIAEKLREMYPLAKAVKVIIEYGSNRWSYRAYVLSNDDTWLYRQEFPTLDELEESVYAVVSQSAKLQAALDAIASARNAA